MLRIYVIQVIQLILTNLNTPIITSLIKLIMNELLPAHKDCALKLFWNALVFKKSHFISLNHLSKIIYNLPSIWQGVWVRPKQSTASHVFMPHQVFKTWFCHRVTQCGKRVLNSNCDVSMNLSGCPFHSKVNTGSSAESPVSPSPANVGWQIKPCRKWEVKIKQAWSCCIYLNMSSEQHLTPNPMALTTCHRWLSPRPEGHKVER